MADDLNRSEDLFVATLSSGTLPVVAIELAQETGQWLLTWPVEPGKGYRVQYKDDLRAPQWIDSPSVVAIEGNQASARELPGPGPQRFFRVAVE